MELNLFHGTGEPIDGPLRPGGYDGLLWTSPDLQIARTYIPQAGLRQLYWRSPFPDARIRPNRWSAAYDIALLAGFPAVAVDWDARGDAISWSPLTPTYRDLEAILTDLGYDLSAPCWLILDRALGRIQPASWRLTGRLFTLTFSQPLRLLDHPKIECDLSQPAYHDTGFFRRAIEQGFDGVRIGDAVTDAEGSMLLHEAIGLTPRGLSRARISSAPADHLLIRERDRALMAA